MSTTVLRAGRAGHVPRADARVAGRAARRIVGGVFAPAAIYKSLVKNICARRRWSRKISHLASPTSIMP